MTREEALKIAKIALEADGGCPVCAQAQIDSLKSAFPEFDWEALAKEADDSGYWGT